MGTQTIQIGGIEDHIHLLFALSRTLSIAETLQQVKSASTKWLNSDLAPNFSWQLGYATPSIAANDSEGAVRYIQSQEAHHRAVTFEDEYRSMLDQAGVEYDERYMWD